MPPLRGSLLPTGGPRAWIAFAVRAGLVGLAGARLARAAGAAAPLAPRHAAPARPVTVVVPARDEEHRIGPCLAALRAEGADVLVVDDGSTDATRAVAEVAGARVVDAGPLPPGWAGKARALDVGLRAAGTPVVVFVDADTRPGRGFVAAAVDALGTTALVTLGARVDAPSAGERWLHPAMLATLVYRLGPPGTLARRPERTMASGQCMVVDRQQLLDSGGFEPVRGALLEDLALARHLAASGHEVRFLDGGAVLDVAGYGSATAAWRGWGRSLDLAPVTAPAWQALDLAVVWAAMALPLPRLLSRRADVVDVVALALRFGTLAGTARAYRRRGLPYWSSPLADVAVAARITAGTLRPARRWRGRRY
jgi:dolichol-phosphate mannosyltransferase